MLLQLKYNINARGREGDSNTWAIYKNVDEGLEDIVYTDHIELKVNVWTDERSYGNGFGMLCEGKIEWRNYPNSNKKFAVIVKEKDES